MSGSGSDRITPRVRSPHRDETSPEHTRYTLVTPPIALAPLFLTRATCFSNLEIGHNVVVKITGKRRLECP
jgi:hypothetical protein